LLLFDCGRLGVELFQSFHELIAANAVRIAVRTIRIVEPEAGQEIAGFRAEVHECFAMNCTKGRTSL
jgi:hypothetical protein